MNPIGDLQGAIEGCPTFERWNDDGEWEDIVILEMARNFGVSSQDLVAKLDRLLSGTSKIDSIDRFFVKLSDHEKRAIRDAIDDVAQGNLTDVRIEKQADRNFTYRATSKGVRFTFNYRPLGSERGGAPEQPHSFMVDVIARRAWS